MITPLYLTCLVYETLETIANRRNTLKTKYLNGLLFGNVDLPYLLSLINFRALQQISRYVISFYIPHFASNYLVNEPIKRLMSHANVEASYLC